MADWRDEYRQRENRLNENRTLSAKQIRETRRDLGKGHEQRMTMKRNAYSCLQCGATIITEDVDEGVTPAVLLRLVEDFPHDRGEQA